MIAVSAEELMVNMLDSHTVPDIEPHSLNFDTAEIDFWAAFHFFCIAINP